MYFVNNKKIDTQSLIVYAIFEAEYTPVARRDNILLLVSSDN